MLKKDIGFLMLLFDFISQANSGDYAYKTAVEELRKIYTYKYQSTARKCVYIL